MEQLKLLFVMLVVARMVRMTLDVDTEVSWTVKQQNESRLP